MEKNNIIRVNFKSKLHHRPLAITDSMCWQTQTFLEICASTLAEEDYWDLLEAIHNAEFYQQVDPDLQDLVHCYYDSLET